MRQENAKNLVNKTEANCSSDSGRRAADLHQLEEVFEITNRLGLHGRPAAKFAITASKYECDVTIKKVGEPLEVSGKSFLGLITMGLSYGSKILVRISGNGDSEKCLKDLRYLVASEFGEAYS